MTRTPEQRRQYRQQEKARHRLKWKARQAISQQLRRGTIKRGNCEKCGKPNAQAHHDDYSKKYEVRWLCAFHHQEWHNEH